MSWLIASNIILWIMAGIMCAAHVNASSGYAASKLECVGLILIGPFLIVAGTIHGLYLASKAWYFVFKAWRLRRKHGTN